MTKWMVGFGVVGCWLALSVPGAGQFVGGDWVQRGEANIYKYRTTPVAFLVLDQEGKLAANAEVRVEQLSHAFPLGFVVHDTFPADYDAEAVGWRVFNAVSLERLSSWRLLQPGGADEFDATVLERAAGQAEAAGLGLRWGSLVSADTFDLPEWAVPLRGTALIEAMRAYVARVGQAFGLRLLDLDVAEKTLDHERLSPAMLRLLALDAAANWPTIPPRLRYDEVFEGPRTFDVVAAMDGALTQRLGVAGFTIDQRFGPRPVAQDQLEPALQRLAKFGRPMVVGALEIGGAHAIETAANAETVLRTLFAEPTVAGIYFSGLSESEVSTPSAALFDDTGEATTVARTADRLFREVWWSDVTLTTNELGQAQTRVFLGAYRVTAELPDGSEVTVRLRLDARREPPEEIVLMPVGEAADTGGTEGAGPAE